MRPFVLRLDSLYAAGILRGVHLTGAASPDGRESHNRILSQRRAEVLAGLIFSTTSVPRQMITAEGLGEDWQRVAEVAADRLSPADNATLSQIILSNPDLDSRERKLRRTGGGGLWRSLVSDVFPAVRRTIVDLSLIAPPAPELSEPLKTLKSLETLETLETLTPLEPEPAPDSPESPAASASASCLRQWSLATNALEWGLGIANIAGGYGFACRWSVALSLHYSAWNYFTSTRKFRTFILRPELRYWLGDGHSGLFVDAHVQMASYNFALGRWHYRIQDRDGHHPALGGGFGLGYRKPLGSGRWAVEGQLGVGVYHLDYNRYVNGGKGQLVDTRRRTWVGIDNVSLSLVYNFNMGGRR